MIKISNILRKKESLSKILELAYSKDSILVLDIDGVLSKYAYGEYNHNACKDSEWLEFAKEHEIYSKAEPIHIMQRLVKKHNIDRVFVLSAAEESEKEQKKNFVLKNYNIKEENIYFTSSSSEKPTKLKELYVDVLCKLPNATPSNVVMIEDTVKTITAIQENSDFSTAHITSFMR